MHVFVTGASGFIGSATVTQLVAAGHRVTGMARSEHGAQAVRAAGAEVFRGDLTDPRRVGEAVADTDAVIHLAYRHGEALDQAADSDRAVIEAIGTTLAGSDRPFVVTSGVLGLPAGRIATEADVPVSSTDNGGRGDNQAVAIALAGRGVRVSVVRLAPCVHERVRRGFAGGLIDAAVRTGVSGYLGDGSQRWPAVHRQDAARLFRLAVERAEAGSVLHGVAEVGVRLRDIAELIGSRLGVPVHPIPSAEAGAQFGWLAASVGTDSPASSDETRRRLDWHPDHPGLLDDMATGDFFTGLTP